MENENSFIPENLRETQKYETRYFFGIILIQFCLNEKYKNYLKILLDLEDEKKCICYKGITGCVFAIIFNSIIINSNFQKTRLWRMVSWDPLR